METIVKTTMMTTVMDGDDDNERSCVERDRKNKRPTSDCHHKQTRKREAIKRKEEENREKTREHSNTISPSL